MVRADVAGDPDEHVPLVDDRAKGVECDRSHHDAVPTCPWTLSLPSLPEVAHGADRAFVARRLRAATAPWRGRRGARGTRGTSPGRAARGLGSASARRRTSPYRRARSSARFESCTRRRGRARGRLHRGGWNRPSRPDAFLREQIGADDAARPIEISNQVTVRSVEQMAAEVPEPFRFGPIQSGDLTCFRMTGTGADASLRTSKRPASFRLRIAPATFRQTVCCMSNAPTITRTRLPRATNVAAVASEQALEEVDFAIQVGRRWTRRP